MHSSQTLIIEQKGNEFIGTHLASIGSRDLDGTLHGKQCKVYTKDGVRINYTFTGTADANTIGKVSLSQYGDANGQPNDMNIVQQVSDVPEDS